MEIISNPTQEDIKNAAKALKAGHLVAFPTETVYGLGADATNKEAVSRIYSVKGRPKDHPLIVHISSINKLSNWAMDIPEYAITLARNFWPGPMTLILKRSELAKDYVTGGQDNVGLRVPNQPVALALLSEFELLGGQGVAAPSANRFGAVSPTTAEAAGEELGNFLSIRDLILDGGQSAVGIESSIFDCTSDHPIVLRPGAITREMIEETTGVMISINMLKSKIRTSGALKSHYSPKAKVIIGTTTEPGDGFIAQANIASPKGAIRLASPKSVEFFAKNLYEALRLGDKLKLKRIVIAPPSGDGLALAINDRINKAENHE